MGGVFQGCTRMISVQLPPNLIYVQDNSFRACTSLISLVIPATVNTLARGCFRNMKCPVVILATTPPSLNTYDNQNNCTFYVPNESVIAYRRASNWSSLRGKIHGFVSGPIEIMRDGQYQYKLQSCFSDATDFSLTIQNNEYLELEFSDGIGIITATGITSETEDISVRMNYEFNFKEVQYSGSFEIALKYREIIDFEDAEVKRICVANWGGEYSSSTNKYGVPGELTYEQAAAVKSVNNIFKNNTKVISFREYKYFTGVTSATDAFYGAKNFRNIELPPNRSSLLESEFHDAYCRNFEVPSTVISIAKNCFHDFEGGGKYVFSEGFTTINSAAFHGCYSNVIMEFPSTLSSIAGGTTLGGSYNRGIIKIVINRDIPPSLGKQDSFNNATHLYIYVPDDYVDTYKSATNWSALAARIHPISEYTG